jgi:hypothetical protein
MTKTTPAPDVVNRDDEHYATLLQAPPLRRDDDEDNPCQAHGSPAKDQGAIACPPINHCKFFLQIGQLLGLYRCKATLGPL